MAGPEQEKRIILYHYFDNGDVDFDFLSARVGLCLKIVKNHFNKWLSGEGHERKPGSGRTLKLNEEQIEELLVYVSENQQLSSRQLAAWAMNQFGMHVGRDCILNTLHVNGYKNWKLRKLPPLTEHHRLARVAWCIFYREFDWEKVFFSDETYFLLVRAKNRYWSIEQPTVHSPVYAPKIGVWGAFSARGKTTLHFFTRAIDSEAYKDILNEFLVEEANALYPDGWFFQQDNARPHVSASTRNFLNSRGVNVIGWPSLSPDLNPIENVWALMKHEVEQREATSVAELKVVIQDVWDGIDLENYWSHMSNRIETCLTLEGATTKY